MSRVAMIIKAVAHEGQRDEGFRLFQEHLAPRAEANPEQEVAIWCADEQDSEKFYLVEVYRDRAAMAANGQTDWFSAYLQAVGPLLDGQPELMLTEPRWIKGVS